MRISILLILILFGSFSQKVERDPRLVGRWMMLFSLDATGEVIKDEFYQKKYVEEYTQSGKLILDPNFLRDDMEARGIKLTALDYAAIPTFDWTTIDNNTLQLDNGELGIRSNRYGFLGDTLIFGYSNGNRRYLLRVK